MIGGIDHLVIACADPDAAARELEESVGLRATAGGRHAGRGTFNRIVWLADGTYLELIGVDDREAAWQQPVGAAALRVLDEHGGGLASYALRDDDLDLTASGLAALGRFGPIIHGSRERDDGERVEWRTSFPVGELAADRTPFLIQHTSAGPEWSPVAQAERARFRHPLGSAVVLVRIDVATIDPPSAAAAIHEQLGLEFRAVADLAVAEINRHVIRLVPPRGMPVPAVVTLAAELEAPRTAELLGLRFDVERAELPLPVADRS